MVRFKHTGDFGNTETFFGKAKRGHYRKVCEKYGKKGVEALAEATPVRTGKTAASWDYEIRENRDGIAICWTNSNINNEWANVAVLLRYGHGTRNGGYVQGIDYITPALRPIFQKFADDAWKEVTSG